LFPDDHSAHNLIRLIYESAADPRQWPIFLQALATGRKAQSVPYDVAKNPWTTRQGPFWTTVFAMENGDIPANQALLASKFYTEYLRAQDCFSMPELQLLPSLMPHVQRAMRLRQRMEALEQTVAALTDVINLLPGGVIVAGAGAQVLATNRAAESILSANSGLKNGKGGLTASNKSESDALRATIADAAANENGSRVPAPIAISGHSTGRPLKVTVAPLTPPTAGKHRQPMAVLFLTDPDKGPEPDLAFLQRAFSLTAAEARVSAALTQGKSVEEIALASGVTLGAIRSHLKRVFSKTGTRRQGELISLLMASGRPLRANGRK
jgi:DNA-binding CsgD family transcriptional regulator